ncbi:hypothetical protein GCM10010862_43750 [Devosia nitrariae]|uniref:Uncharacterized protein n=2 Tax=Devosia nitrariae TaxID=2071872 RepID=A0ABQ5WBE8_9HYPH|nr:hypothetical protein GCM10010862_43750 [Devosia nitrariae]
MIRELGAALAVVAVYLLVLLVPLHQAAGLQQDLADLGYEGPSWSICAAGSAGLADGEAPFGLTCPIAGLGKDEIATVEPPPVEVDILRIAQTTAYPERTAHAGPATSRYVGQPRAPPVPV